MSTTFTYIFLEIASVGTYVTAVHVAKGLFSWSMDVLSKDLAYIDPNSTANLKKFDMPTTVVTALLMLLMIAIVGLVSSSFGLNPFISWPLAVLPLVVVYVGFHLQVVEYMYASKALDRDSWREWLDDERSDQIISAICIESGQVRAFRQVLLWVSMVSMASYVAVGSIWLSVTSVPGEGAISFMILTLACPTTTATRSVFFNFADLHKKLLLECVNLDRSADDYLAPTPADFLAVNRWRMKGQQRIFQLANLLRRATPKVRRRLSVRQFEEVYGAYLGLADLLQESSTTATDKSELANLGRAAATLVTNLNLVAAAKKILEIPGVNPPEVRPLGRLRKGLDFMTDMVERRKSLGKPLLVLALLLVLVWAVIGGQAQIIVPLLHKLFGM